PGERSPCASPCSRYIDISAGTEFHTVTPWSCTSRYHAAGSRRAAGSGRTTAPPAPRTPKMSHTDRSKLNDDRPRTRSVGPIWYRALTSTQVFSAARCDTATPFGVPVEPDV